MVTLVIRGDPKRLRSAASFAVSACFHGSMLALVAFGGGIPADRARSLYDQEIKRDEKKIIWYRLSTKLPDIAPAEAAQDPRPPRARVKSLQTMVAGIKDEEKPAPFIWTAEPPAPAPKPVALPNVIAVAPPRVLRPFVTPPEVKAVAAAPKLPDAPRVEANLQAKPVPIEVTVAKPAPRAFVPPQDARMARQAALLLPEAPTAKDTVVEPNALPFAPAASRPRPRDFVPPAKTASTNGPVALPAAPETSVGASAPREIAALRRTYMVPPARPEDRTAPSVGSEAPAINAAPMAPAETTLAIVGLNPANVTEVPPPPASRPAGFSAGPTVRNEGSNPTNNGIALLNVPGLSVKSGPRDDRPTLMATFSPTSKENLLAAARSVGGVTVGNAPAESRPTRVAEAPDPRLAGRVVYTVAIQMPNITSFTGSWMVWFAEREPLPGSPQIDMRAPVPLRKVDPKYVAEAAAERVEGTVRLAGVIRKDGHVDGIVLLRHLDDRLDRTAQEALAKWEWTPALRNGSAVDVDAVFEIPFHLAPRSTK
jgi:TonB family protein